MKVNSKQCIVWEYDLPTDEVSVASVLIDGRYPSEGWGINNDVEQVYFIVSGRGKVVLGAKEYWVKKDDVVYFEKGDKYWVEGDKLRLVVINAPAWTSAQYHVVNK